MHLFKPARINVGVLIIASNLCFDIHSHCQMRIDARRAAEIAYRAVYFRRWHYIAEM